MESSLKKSVRNVLFGPRSSHSIKQWSHILMKASKNPTAILEPPFCTKERNALWEGRLRFSIVTFVTWLKKRRPERKEYCLEKIVAWKVFYTRNMFIAAPPDGVRGRSMNKLKQANMWKMFLLGDGGGGGMLKGRRKLWTWY